MNNEVKQYSKRPLYVLAIQFTPESYLAVKNWLPGHEYLIYDKKFYLNTDDGHMLVENTDWIVLDEGVYSVWENKKFMIHHKLKFAGQQIKTNIELYNDQKRNAGVI